jgi:hypothetical protein
VQVSGLACLGWGAGERGFIFDVFVDGAAGYTGWRHFVGGVAVSRESGDCDDFEG